MKYGVKFFILFCFYVFVTPSMNETRTRSFGTVRTVNWDPFCKNGGDIHVIRWMDETDSLI